MEFFWRGFKSSLSSPIKCSNDTLSVRRNKRSTRKKRNSCKQKCLPLDWKTPTGLPPATSHLLLPWTLCAAPLYSWQMFPFLSNGDDDKSWPRRFSEISLPTLPTTNCCPSECICVCVFVCVSVSWLSSALWIFITTFARDRLSDVNSLRRSCRRCLLLLIAKLLPFTSHPLPLPLLLLPPPSYNLTFKWIM